MYGSGLWFSLKNDFIKYALNIQGSNGFGVQRFKVQCSSLTLLNIELFKTQYLNFEHLSHPNLHIINSISFITDRLVEVGANHEVEITAGGFNMHGGGVVRILVAVSVVTGSVATDIASLVSYVPKIYRPICQ